MRYGVGRRIVSLKSLLKSLARGVCFLSISPVLGLYRLSELAVGRERAFPGLSQCLSLLPGLLGVYQRHAAYRRVLTECGENAWVGFGVLLTHPDTQLGPYVYLGHYSVLGRCRIGRDVLVGSFVSIMNGSRQHGIERLDLPVREQPGEWPLITIGEDSWIGDHAVIMADVGKHCVVAAGSVVTKSVPDYAIVAGCPAKILRYRNEPTAELCAATESPVSAAPVA